MKLKETELKGKIINLLSKPVKYKHGRNQKEVKQHLLDCGASKVSRYATKGHDFVLIGQEHVFSNLYDRSGQLLFENEIIESEKQKLSYFPDLEAKLYEMLRRLYKQTNVIFDYLSIGKGLTEDELVVIERKFGNKIPMAIREFYSIFGHIKLLWHFKNIPLNRRTEINSGAFCLHSGQHEGSIHFMPLEEVLFTDWKKEEHNIPESLDVKIFDYYSLYHMLGVEMSDVEDPIVYLGEDHGAGFEKIQYSFSSYIKMVFGLYGYINRFKHLEFWTIDQNGSIFENKNWESSYNGFIDLDFSNRVASEKYFCEIIELVNEGELELALKKASSFWREDPRVMAVLLDIFAIQGDSEAYFDYFKGFIKNSSFNLSDYESSTKHHAFINTDEYKKIKETLSNKT